MSDDKDHQVHGVKNNEMEIRKVSNGLVFSYLELVVTFGLIFIGLGLVVFQALK